MDFVRLDRADTVVTATHALEVGAEIEGFRYNCTHPIRAQGCHDNYADG